MNTMFGVRFSVSAGRCTRGAYLQLLKVKSANTKCDYMLIIDTEGLRAPELDSSQTQQHDNELATLVIGLAGVTIVNMFGEVPADISDILQTTVHAFLRMKNAEMQHTPSCQFVRHHVANVSSSKTSEGSDRFQTTLDDMTKIAAKAEHLEGQYEQFSDVISFNNKTDVQNFPSLWEGNPPMAPVNPAYCEAAQKLQTKFLQLSNMSGSLCTLQDFQLRLSTLWEAILKENFVFSFKNTLEVDAFSSLDVEYGKWSWRLQSCIIKWESEVNNALLSAKKEDLAAVQDEKIRKVHKKIDKEYEDIKVDFKAFFEDKPPMIAGVVIKWRAQYDIQLENLKNDHKQKAVQHCNALRENIKALEKVNDMKDTERKRIDSELKKLVFEMDIKPDAGHELKDEELAAIEKEFDSRWERWMEDIEKQHPLPERHNIHDQIIFCLRTNCGLKKHDQLLVEKEKQKSIFKRGQLPVSIKLDPQRHLNVGKIEQMKSIFWSSDERVRKAEKATEVFLSEAQSTLAKQKDTLYDDHHIVSIVRKLVQSIDAFESSQDKQFTFTADYRIELIMEVAGHALDVYTQACQKKIDEHPKTYLATLRPIYKDNFRASCNAIAQEKALARGLVKLIDRSLKDAIRDKVKEELILDIKNKYSTVFDSKKKLIGKLLLRLMEKESFSAYQTYLTDVSQSCFDYIREFITTNYWMNGQQNTLSLISKVLMVKMEQLQTAAYCCKQEVTDTCKEAEMLQGWLSKFQSSVSSFVRLNKDEKDALLAPQMGGDIEMFIKEFIKELKLCETKHTAGLNEIFKTIDVCDIASTLRYSLAGCYYQCVFCKEQCLYTFTHSCDHQCSLHRPQCLGGWRDSQSREMTLESCTELLGANGNFYPPNRSSTIPYREYRSVNDEYKRWYIPVGGSDVSTYWKWFIVRFLKELAKWYDFETPNIPWTWLWLTKSHAKQDIEKNYGVS